MRLFLIGLTSLILVLFFQNCAKDLPDSLYQQESNFSVTSPPGTGGLDSIGAQPKGIVMNGTGRSFADGTYAASCNEYRNPAPPYAYSGSTGDGVYTVQSTVLAAGTAAGSIMNVYCDMTTDQGGWTLIANVPPSSSGQWEYNASTYVASELPDSLSRTGMVLPSRVDSKIPNYSEVMFMDSGLANWFVVSKSNSFYMHNYKGVCRDAEVITDRSFTISRASNGMASLYAFWSSGCPNNADRVTTGGNECARTFVNFDMTCRPAAGTMIRAFVR